MMWLVVILLILGTMLLVGEVIVLFLLVMGATFGSPTRTEGWYKRLNRRGR